MLISNVDRKLTYPIPPAAPVMTTTFPATLRSGLVGSTAGYISR